MQVARASECPDKACSKVGQTLVSTLPETMALTCMHSSISCRSYGSNSGLARARASACPPSAPSHGSGAPSSRGAPSVSIVTVYYQDSEARHGYLRGPFKCL